ncbi:MAG: hypothetical protein K2X41_07430 [Hyphomicrobium sp.]|nr:hypothetical protein [Hyphomicrobium sp.]
MNILKSVVLGFIAGAIATLTIHEVISWLFLNYWTGWDRQSWSMEPVTNPYFPDFVVPQIVSAAFWGGLWGGLFGLILGARPQGMMTIRGAILGIFGPALIGVFILVPLLTERFPPFFGGDMSKIIPVLAILAGYGAVTAWLYAFFRYGRLP